MKNGGIGRLLVQFIEDVVPGTFREQKWDIGYLTDRLTIHCKIGSFQELDIELRCRGIPSYKISDIGIDRLRIAAQPVKICPTANSGFVRLYAPIRTAFSTCVPYLPR